MLAEPTPHAPELTDRMRHMSITLLRNRVLHILPATTDRPGNPHHSLVLYAMINQELYIPHMAHLSFYATGTTPVHYLHSPDLAITLQMGFEAATRRVQGGWGFTSKGKQWERARPRAQL